MDEVDAVPRPRRQRPKDSFQYELQSKLRQRKSQGLSADITDSDDDVLGSYGTDYQPKRPARPGSAKYRSDKSPDLSRGLGTTTMRARDLTKLLSHSGGHSDDDDDEEVMAATLGKSRSSGSWQPPVYKTPSPQQDMKSMRKTPTGGSPKDQSHLESLYGRKTPSRESPKEQTSKLDSIFGRKTPTGNSPKEQSRPESLYGRKTPTKEQSKLESLYERKTPPKENQKDYGKTDLYDRKRSLKDRKSPGLSKEDIIFGRKTPTSTSDAGRWQPPNFRNISPTSASSPDHSRGSRGVTPTDHLNPINETPREKTTPRLQRGERLRNDDSPNRQVSFGERPKPQARSKIRERKTSPTLNSSPTLGSSGMKRVTPTMDLFGKTRSDAAQDMEKYMESDRKGGLSKDGRKIPESSRDSLIDRQLGGKSNQRDKVRRAGSRERSPSLGRNSKSPSGKKTPTGQRGIADRKSPLDKKIKDEELQRKQSLNQNSSLLDFLTGGSNAHTKLQDEKKDKKLKRADDDIDDIFASNYKSLQKKSLSSERMSPDHFSRKPSLGLGGRKTPEPRRKSVEEQDEYQNRLRDRDKSRDMDKDRDMDKEKAKEKRREKKNEDASSVCEEIPLDPQAKMAKVEEKSKKSGKQTTERARADNVIDAISDAQTMMYIEPAKKVRPVTAEAKVQHRPKPRYGILPGSATATQTLTERQFNSTSDIRDAIYEEWYAERIKQAKKKKKEDEKKKKDEEEKKKQEEDEKRHEAMLSYKSWTEKKKETFDKEQAKKRRMEEAKKEKENQEREEKREASKKLFAHWKQEKDARTRLEQRKKKEKEDDEKRSKEEEEYKKRKEKETAFRGWKHRKEQELKCQQKDAKDEKKALKMKKEQEEEEKRRKEHDALQKYNDWVEDKEKQKENEKRRTKYFEMSEDRPAWSPASRTIPFGR